MNSDEFRASVAAVAPPWALSAPGAGGFYWPLLEAEWAALVEGLLSGAEKA
jgi:hypothetical protein